MHYTRLGTSSHWRTAQNPYKGVIRYVGGDKTQRKTEEKIEGWCFGGYEVHKGEELEGA